MPVENWQGDFKMADKIRDQLEAVAMKLRRAHMKLDAAVIRIQSGAGGTSEKTAVDEIIAAQKLIRDVQKGI